LVLPGDVTPEEVEILAVSRFPRAEWEDAGTTAGTASGTTAKGVTAKGATAKGAAPRGRSRQPAGPAGARALRLSRLSTLEGPYAVDRGAATGVCLRAGVGIAYVVQAPVERGDPPGSGGGDRDGLRRAFPDGLPVRDEQRTVAWLVDAARRLGGGVRVVGSRGPVLLVPDPAAAVDVTVWSDIWL